MHRPERAEVSEKRGKEGLLPLIQSSPGYGGRSSTTRSRTSDETGVLFSTHSADSTRLFPWARGHLATPRTLNRKDATVGQSDNAFVYHTVKNSRKVTVQKAWMDGRSDERGLLSPAIGVIRRPPGDRESVDKVLQIDE